MKANDSLSAVYLTGSLVKLFHEFRPAHPGRIAVHGVLGGFAGLAVFRHIIPGCLTDFFLRCGGGIDGGIIYDGDADLVAVFLVKLCGIVHGHGGPGIEACLDEDVAAAFDMAAGMQVAVKAQTVHVIHETFHLRQEKFPCRVVREEWYHLGTPVIMDADAVDSVRYIYSKAFCGHSDRSQSVLQKYRSEEGFHDEVHEVK